MDSDFQIISFMVTLVEGPSNLIACMRVCVCACVCVCVFMYVCACVCVLGEREGLKLPPIFWPMQYVVINDVSF